ncbi:DUF4382 domain-containing protein [Chloroflexi bacterium TSY]|nr:DUF4382 domain-containing protein [Chloroflexi bacterium TSY]
MKRYLFIVTVLLLTILTAAGCRDRTQRLGTLEIHVWDHREAIDDFRTLGLTISVIAIHAAEESRTEGWVELPTSVQELELTQLVDGAKETIMQSDIDTGVYDAVRLNLDQITGILTNGEQATVKDAFQPVALDFQIRHNETTVLGVDLVVFDMSDHPGRGYELHIREASVIQGK